jgi:HKD family nuclease
MKCQFIPDSKVIGILKQLINDCDQVYWAIAWASPNEVFADALQHKAKFSSLIVGTHMYQTHPEALKKLQDIPVSKVMDPKHSQLFHPKLYLFTRGKSFSVLIGSHNFTGAAMHGNREASVLLEGSVTEAIFKNLRDYVTYSYAKGERLHADFIYSYERQWHLKRQAQKALESFVHVQKPTRVATKVELQAASWDDYVSELRSRHQALEPRLNVLRGLEHVFETTPKFKDMPLLTRKMVAGTSGFVDGTDFGYFGSMLGSGVFRSVLNNRPEQLSRSLDCIPLYGEVTEDHYNQFVSALIAAFKDESRSVDLPVASRLLAMKRPDVFVALNNGNRKSLCEQLGTAPTTTRLDNYWERIIVQVQQTPWWSAPCPSSPDERELWKGRVALLDTLHYTG